MVRINSVLTAFLTAVFLFSAVMVIVQLLGEQGITGHATSGTTISNVTVSKSFSITLSTNLSNGILFGNLSTITNANASSNYDGTGASNQTTYFINVSSDATVNVDFCISANAALTDSSSGDTIGLGNESYANASTTSGTVPSPSNEVSFTTSNVKSGLNFAPGNANYYRFWLDVPSATPSGTYNNSISFTGVENADACP